MVWLIITSSWQSNADMLCGASLLTARLAATAFHCVRNIQTTGAKVSCDHRKVILLRLHDYESMTLSDGKRYVVVGAHHDPAHWKHQAEGRRVPVVDVKYPANPGFQEEDEESHDFALLVL